MKKHSYFSNDVTEFLFLLSKHEVRYLIVGGEAVIYYGYARLTGDIDLFYERTLENTTNLFAALKEFWKGEIPGIERQSELRRNGLIVQFGVPPNRIDIINVIEAIKFEKAWEWKKIETSSYRKKSFPIFYIGLDDLIRNKKAVGRNKDKDDLSFLQQARKRKRKRKQKDSTNQPINQSTN